jgi:lipopolysaccharide/colanic/teichoic acid biosynthesis glycosyltransferase
MYLTLKRLLDVAGAVTLLLLTAPLLLLIAAAVRLTLGRPVFFRQMRPGRQERLFTCFKFRTMNDACDEEGKLLEDEVRTTRLGRFLRRTSMDELPQLWNILRGEASFVGPRPLFVRYLPHYTQEERRRHSVRPGLTGWAQIHGRNRLPFERRLELDVWYVDHLSFWLDLRILLQTSWMVLMQKGVAIDAAALDELRTPKADSGSMVISG